MTSTNSTLNEVVNARNSKEKLALEILRRLDNGWKKGDLRYNENTKSIPYPIDEDDILKILRKITEEEARHVLENCSMVTMAEFMAVLLNYRQENSWGRWSMQGLNGQYSPV